MKALLLTATLMIGCAATTSPQTIIDEPATEVIEVKSYYVLMPNLAQTYELSPVVVLYTHVGAAYSYEMDDLMSLKYEGKLILFSVVDNHIYDITNAQKLTNEDFYIINLNPYTHSSVMDGILAMNVEPEKDDDADGPDFIYMCGEGIPNEQCGFVVDPEEPEFIKNIRSVPEGATTPIGEGFKPSKGGYDMRMDRVLNPHDDGMVDQSRPGQPLANLAN